MHLIQIEYEFAGFVFVLIALIKCNNLWSKGKIIYIHTLHLCTVNLFISIIKTHIPNQKYINVVLQCIIIVCSVLSYQTIQSLGLIFIAVNTAILGYS